jgi:hypothetical protein
MRQVVTIHNYKQMVQAFEQAASQGGAVTLQNAPDSIFYAGSLYFLKMFEQVCRLFPQVRAEFILDCSDAGAEVIAAMQDGHKNIKSSAKPEIRAKLKAIAVEHNVNFIEID